MSDATQFSGLPLRVDTHALERYVKCDAQQYGFTLPEFSEMLAEVVRRSFPEGCRGDDREHFLNSLHLNDLVLAQACLRGVEKAWDRFLALYREKLYRMAASLSGPDTGARELADSLYADLFGTRKNEAGERISKLEAYTGRGTLEGWLRVVLSQEYVNRYRIARRHVSFDDEIETEASENALLPGGVSEPEQQSLAEATDVALNTLSDEEQFLLAAHYLDSRTLAQIGRLLKVHESTVSRRIDKIMSTLRKRVVNELRASGISKREAEAMLQVDVRSVAVDVRHYLTQGWRRRTF